WGWGIGGLVMVGWLVSCARGMEWWWIGAGRGYTEESLLIIRNLGIQTRTCFSATFSTLFLLSPLPTLLSALASFLPHPPQLALPKTLPEYPPSRVQNGVLPLF
ncbi:hypothetical protein BGX38DRAFT_1217513, partial [Terfezia claveryi]